MVSADRVGDVLQPNSPPDPLVLLVTVHMLAMLLRVKVVYELEPHLEEVKATSAPCISSPA